MLFTSLKPSKKCQVSSVVKDMFRVPHALQPCVNLLGKCLPLGSFVCDVFLCFLVFLSLSHVLSGLVLDCIDILSLPSPFLLKLLIRIQIYLAEITPSDSLPKKLHVEDTQSVA